MTHALGGGNNAVSIAPESVPTMGLARNIGSCESPMYEASRPRGAMVAVYS